MVAVILTILKIIGLILLYLLCAIILILLMVLFIPLRYHVHASYPQTPYLRMRCYWFLRIIAVRVWLEDNDLQYIARVAGITILNSKKQTRKRKRNPDAASDEEQMDDEVDEQVGEDAFDNKVAQGDGIETEQGLRREAMEDVAHESSPRQDKKDQGKKQGVFASILEKISYTSQNFRAKIEKVWNDISFYLEIYQSKQVQELIPYCKKELIRLWRNIRPKKAKGTLQFGFEDPSTTGTLLSVLALAYPLFGKQIVLLPDFENKVLDGMIYFRGRITLFVVALVAVKIYYDKRLQYTLKRIKRRMQYGR